jgi:hypothetical protein
LRRLCFAFAGKFSRLDMDRQNNFTPNELRYSSWDADAIASDNGSWRVAISDSIIWPTVSPLD